MEKSIEGILTSFSRKADGSYKLVFITQELQPEMVAMIAQIAGKFGNIKFEESL